jgi:argininosuccinate synthase
LVRKIVLAYSGGLDTSVSVMWLKEKYDAEVVTVTLDIGQNEDMSEVEERAYESGSSKHYTIDALDEFVSEYVSRAIKVGAMYEEKYPLSTALGRPLIAKKLVDIAKKENADSVAHGCTGKGNDQVRLEVTVKSLAPSLNVIAPVREWNMTRDEEIVYARKKNIPVKASRSIYSVDQNIWGRSIESGVLEHPDQEPPYEVFEWVVPPEEAPDSPCYIELGFDNGIPVSLNGKEMKLTSLISKLNVIAGKNGVGIIDHIEDRLVGIKSREVYECPAAVTIMEAHSDLEKLVLTRMELEFKKNAERAWSWLVYSGLWEEPLRYDIESLVDRMQSRVNGKVKLKLYKGGLRVVGRSSTYQLYSIDLSTYGSGSKFDQKKAEGFIELWGLQTRTANKVMKGDFYVEYSGNRKEIKEAEQGSN